MVPWGPPSIKTGPSEESISPLETLQPPLPFPQQRRPNQGRSGKQKQQPQFASRPAAKANVAHREVIIGTPFV
jgi:hypothetical protein